LKKKNKGAGSEIVRQDEQAALERLEDIEDLKALKVMRKRALKFRKLEDAELPQGCQADPERAPKL
jgi:hypothetical protein